MTHYLFFRSRGLAVLFPSLAVVALICLVAPADLAQNPVNSGVSVLLIGLAPIAGAVFWAPLVASPMPELESAVPPNPVRRLRVAWLAFGIATLTSAGVLVMAVRGLDWWFAILLTRNTFFGVGLATISGVLLPRKASWLPVAAYVGACWLAGTNDEIGTANSWALPCYLADSVAGLAISIAVLAAASILYAVRAPHRWQQ